MKKLLGTFIIALFATVVLGQSKTEEIKPAVLPTCTADWVKNNLQGFTIDKAYKIENKGEVSYISSAVKQKSVQWISVDKNCKSVKKITSEEAKTMMQGTPTIDHAKPSVPPKTDKKAKPATTGNPK